MSTMASHITSLTIVCSTVYSGADQRKHQSSASLAFVRGIHRPPVNSPHIGTVTRKSFHFMTSSWPFHLPCSSTCLYSSSAFRFCFTPNFANYITLWDILLWCLLLLCGYLYLCQIKISHLKIRYLRVPNFKVVAIPWQWWECIMTAVLPKPARWHTLCSSSNALIPERSMEPMHTYRRHYYICRISHSRDGTSCLYIP